MSDDARLSDLLSRWRQLQAEGVAPTAGELCRDCPELAPELERRLTGLEAMERMAAAVNTPTPTETIEPPVGLPPGRDFLAAADLLEALGQHRLLEPARLRELVGGLPVPLPEARALAEDLVRQGWLTRYQAEPLLQGRGQELVVGPYVLLERLGEGGMGTVYKARHRPMDRIVALKIIRPERLAQADARQRFQREIRALAQLSHPNIIAAHHADSVGNTSFLVMEYVAGTDLHRLVADSGPLPVGQACECVRQAALGLQHAFEKGLVHRDIKPSNLLLARDSGVIKLLDLGLARLHDEDAQATLSSELTKDGVVLGTPDYMAPEQALDPRQADIRADVYSLGCTLYFLLTGRPPFAGGTLMQKLLAHQQDQPPAVESLRPGLPAGVVAVLRKLLAKRPEDRYQLPAEVAAALAALTTEPEAATPPEREPGLDKRPVAKLLVNVGKILGAPAGKAPRAEEQTESLQPRAAGQRREVDRRQMAKLLVRVGKMLMQMGKLLALVLLIVGGGIVAYRALAPAERVTETPQDFQARIEKLVGQEKFPEALAEIGKAEQPEEVKARARKDLRAAALSWARQRFHDRRGLEDVLQTLKRLLEYFPGDGELASLRNDTGKVYVTQEVQRLRTEQRFAQAYGLVSESGLASADWAVTLKKGLLKAWADEAGRDLDKERRYLQAARLAGELLKVEPGHADAARIESKAKQQMRAVRVAVDKLLGQKQFEAACRQVDENWPADEDDIRGKIRARWYGAAADLRKARDWQAAARALAELRTQFPGEEKKAEELAQAIDRDDLEDTVARALGSGKPDQLQQAAQLLHGKRGKLLDLSRRTQLAQRIRDTISTGSVPDRILAAVQPVALTPVEFDRSRKQLTGLRGKADAGPGKQIDELLAFLAKAEKIAAEPLGGRFRAFEEDLVFNESLTAAQKEALDKLYDRLLDRRIHTALVRYADEGKWREGLADCRKRKGPPATWSVWALAWRVECLAELAGKDADLKGALAEAASALAKHIPEAEARPYVLYVRALAAAGGDSVPEEAPWLVQSFGKEPLAPELKSGHRKRRAAALLLASARDLRRSKGTFVEPFGSKANADKAFPWLEIAQRLAGDSPTDELLRDMVLAAWHKTKPDLALAGKVVATVVRPEALKRLPPEDAYRFLMIHAKTRDASPAGRKAALESYLATLRRVRDLARVDLTENAGRYENVVKPVCQDFYDSVIKPLAQDRDESRFLPAKPGDDLRDLLARLCAETGRMIEANWSPWLEVNELADKTPERVYDLYREAARHATGNADRAEYTLLAGSAYLVLPRPVADILKILREHAKKALELDRDYAGGHALTGIARLLESRTLLDLGARMKLLEAADADLGTALERCKALGKEKAEELSSLVLRSRAMTCMELANYVLDKESKKKYLERGEADIKKVLEWGGRNPLTHAIYGCLLEDAGLYLGDPKTYYPKAIAEFGLAMTDRKRLAILGQAKAYVDYGRVQVRQAERLVAQGRGKDAKKHLDAARERLTQAITYTKEPQEAVEAYWCLGKLHLLSDEPIKSKKAFTAGRTLAQKHGSKIWEEALLSAWANSAYFMALLRYSEGRPFTARGYLKEAKAAARDLGNFDVTQAAWLRVKTLDLRARLGDGKLDFNDLFKEIARGLAAARPQDRVFRMRLLSDRASLHFNNSANDPKAYQKSYRDATEALRLARNLPGEEMTRGRTHGFAGLALLMTAWKGDQILKAAEKPKIPEKQKAAEKQEGEQIPPPKGQTPPAPLADASLKAAAEHFRQAAALTPKVEAAMWKFWLVKALHNVRTSDVRERANIFEEALRNAAEALKDLPRAQDRKAARVEKDALAEGAPAALRKALDLYPKDQSAWKWNWRLAALLHEGGVAASRAEARKLVQRAVVGMPKEAPAAYREQILSLRKQLEQDKQPPG